MMACGVNRSKSSSSSLPSIIAATGRTGFRAFYSNYGSAVKIAAPGGDVNVGGTPGAIYSTLLNSYGYKQGTSMAAPHVAGVVGLLKAVNDTLTTDQVLEVLQGTVISFPTASPPSAAQVCSNVNYSCGAGIVNVEAATAFVDGDNPPVWTTPTITLSDIESQKMRVN
jgi:serine protease